MYERHDPQLRTLCNIKKAIGKTPERKAPRHVAPRRSEIWVLAQDFEGTLKFDNERKPQFSALLFGVENCASMSNEPAFRPDGAGYRKPE